MKARIIGLVAGACTATLAAMPTHSQDRPIKLRQIYRPGDAVTWKTEGAVDANGSSFNMVNTAKYTVKAVRPDGKVTIEEKLLTVTATVNGVTGNLPLDPPVTVVRDRLNRLIDIHLDRTEETAFRPELTALVHAIGFPILTDRAVKPDDTWETQVVDPAVEGKKVRVKTTFVGWDRVDGPTTWKLNQTADAETDSLGGKLRLSGTFWLDTTTGQTVQSEIEIRNLPSRYGTLNEKLRRTRVKTVTEP